MNSRARSAAAAVVVLALMLASSGILRARDARTLVSTSGERWLYVRSPRVMRLLSMNFAAVSADS
jgi:hypothetical protein